MNGLENLKAGDKVIIVHHHRFGDTFISGAITVGHVTSKWLVGVKSESNPYPTRIVIATGRQVGEPFGDHYYAESDPYIAAIREAREKRNEAGILAAKVQKAIENPRDRDVMIEQLKTIIAEAEAEKVADAEAVTA